MSTKPSFHFPQHSQEEKPWLKYPGPEKSSNGHSRLFSPPYKHQNQLTNSPDQFALPRPQHPHSHHHNHSHASRSETLPLGHRRDRSSSRVHSSNNSNASNASLPMSLAESNSSSDSLGHLAQLPSQRSPTPSSKPRTLSDELSSAFQSNGGSTPSTSKAAYPSPITPSDLLGIPDPSASSTFSSPSPSSVTSPSLEPRAESPLEGSEPKGHKLRPSPLSINTTFNNNSLQGSAFPFRGADSPTSARGSFSASEGPGSPRVNLGAASGSRSPPLPRLSHSSSASNSSYSNPSSPSSTTAPCSALCSHPKGHNHHSHSHHHHPHCSHHKNDRHNRHHHPTCHHFSPGHRHSSRSGKTSKHPHRYSAPLFGPGHEDELNALNSGEENRLDVALPGDVPLEMEEPTTSTAVTIVGSTPAFGIGALRDQREREDGLMCLDVTEPPAKRQRSAAAVILGAAVETVIFTSAVALSAYQLLTGKGKQQLDATMTFADESNTADSTAEQSMVHVKSAPMNIPSRNIRHKNSDQLGKSLHHNGTHHKSKHYKSRHGLSASLPHAYGHDDHEGGNLLMRPNTGTEDNDEQFLRMEAQLSSLIAEGKRALSSRIPDLTKA
ncbi:hypothetical protein EDD21DRAFT_448999 [Dissophora ornata]|nr:hypothetical protein EDD21DRAFT_448999 [Dissophora ornata]